MSDDQPKPSGKNRYCCVCGSDMGFVENRFYHRDDTCGGHECERELAHAIEAEREEAHAEVDRYYDAGW